MINFIEEFYYGNIVPQARTLEHNKKVQHDMQILTENEGFLLIKLCLSFYLGYLSVFLHAELIKGFSLPYLCRRFLFLSGNLNHILNKAVKKQQKSCLKVAKKLAVRLREVTPENSLRTFWPKNSPKMPENKKKLH